MSKIKTHKRSAVLHARVHRHVKMAVVPHRENQFRPHLVRRHGLAVLLVMVAALFFGSNWVSSGTVLGSRAAITAESLLTNTNEVRSRQHLASLLYSEQLSQAAYMKAKDMLKQQYWAHNAPDGTTPWHWFAEVDYNYSYAGENLAKNFRSTSAAITAWMASDEHRQNILSPDYSEVGFAVVDGMLKNRPTTLIVALYGHPASEKDAPTVAGVQERTAPIAGNMNIITQFGIALQTASPAALGSAMLLMFGAIIALFAHVYRKRMPLAIRRSWRYHHGLYKAGGLTVLAILIVALYSGGQI